MSIDSINNSASTRPGSQVKTNADAVDKQSFLNLLVAQLKNQDPISPVDNTAFISQLASFQSLEGQTDMNKTLTSLVDIQQSQLGLQGLSQAALLVGKHVTWEESGTNTERSGVVDAVTVENGVMMVTVGENRIPIGALTGIGKQPAAGSTPAATGGSQTPANGGSGSTGGTTAGSSGPVAGAGSIGNAVAAQQNQS